MAFNVDNNDSYYYNNDSKSSLLTTNRNEKYFLGDRKTFMKELKDKIDDITVGLADSDVTSMVIDGELIEDKSEPGALFYIQTKLNELKDMNRTLISTFDYLKEIEKEVSRLIQ